MATEYERLEQQLKQTKTDVETHEAQLKKKWGEISELKFAMQEATPLEEKIKRSLSEINLFFYGGLPAAAVTISLLYASSIATNFSDKALAAIFATLSGGITMMCGYGTLVNFLDFRKYQRQAQGAPQ